jgi:transmembrane sensor
MMTISEQAARWLFELEDPGPATLADFAAWLKASPVHVEEFLLITSAWKAFDGFDAERRIQLDRILDEARDTVQGLAAHAPAEQSSERKRRGWTFAAVGLGATALAAWALMALFSGSANTYATSTGEQRAFKLEDGSVVHLNTQSQVSVHFSKDARTVELVKGEALFTVERDPLRPFRVKADDAVIQAIGTQFNVYRRDEGTTVSVVEGVVQVLPEVAAKAERLAAGEQARLSRDGHIDKQHVSDIDQVTAWRQRRLVFRGDSLEVVAREFNRYNKLQIALEGPDVQAKRLTGVFDADDPESLVLFLSGDADLTIATDSSTVHIRHR